MMKTKTMNYEMKRENAGGEKPEPSLCSWEETRKIPNGMALSPPASETLLSPAGHLIQSMRNLFSIPCVLSTWLWEMPKKGFKEIVNVPHLPNGSSKLFCEEGIIIVPTL